MLPRHDAGNARVQLMMLLRRAGHCAACPAMMQQRVCHIVCMIMMRMRMRMWMGMGMGMCVGMAMWVGMR